MSPIAVPSLAWLLTISSLWVTAMPFNTEQGDVAEPREISRAVACSRDAIDRCRDSGTGLDWPTCFASVCAPAIEPGSFKREEELCTEQNLVQCAIVEWREAETCFQELCL